MNEHHLHRFLYEPESWNGWRKQNPTLRPDLSGAVLNTRAPTSTLSRANSPFRIFHMRTVPGIDLHGADLTSSQIRFADLACANLAGADCRNAEFRHAALVGADLSRADLRGTQFLKTDLTGANFAGAVLGGTYFGYSTLRDVAGLSAVRHAGRSHIDQFSLLVSEPPLDVLQACGTDTNVLRMWQIFRGQHPYRSAFVSYSGRDEAFAQTLRFALTHFGAPSWFAPQDLRQEAGDDGRIELQRDLYDFIDAAECLILVITPNILSSGWVGLEVQRARSRKPVVPILAADMPAPGSPHWTSLLAPCSDTKKFSQLNVREYAEYLSAILRTGFLDFRNFVQAEHWHTGVAQLLDVIKR